MVKDTIPVARWAEGDLVQSKAGGPKMVVDAVHIPYRSSMDVIALDLGRTDTAKAKSSPSGISYSCIYWTGNKRNRETFVEEGLQDWAASTS